MALIALVYVSLATDKNISETELSELLKQARAKNQKLAITGMLLFRNGFFIQVLEGDESVVVPLYEVIKRDKRHGSVTQIFRSAIQARSFDDWSMGFHYVENQDLVNLAGFTEFLDMPFNCDFFSKNPSHAQTLLYSFKQRHANRL